MYNFLDNLSQNPENDLYNAEFDVIWTHLVEGAN